MRIASLALLGCIGLSGAAFAQSNPGFVFGQVPTAAQWNSYFTTKADAVSGTLTSPTISGGTVTGAAISGGSISGLASALTVGNGGTGLTSGTSGGVPYFASSSGLASSAALVANGLVIGGGAGSAPSTITAGAAGQILYGSSGAPAFATPAFVTATPSNPTAVTPGTSTAQMLGLAGAITPGATGRMRVQVTGSVLVGSTTNGASIKCMYGTGTAPANGASAAGTVIGNPVTYLAGSTTAVTPFSCGGVISGAAVGTALWLDLAVLNTTGSQAVTVSSVTISASEF